MKTFFLLSRFMGHCRRMIHCSYGHFNSYCNSKKELKENKQKDSRELYILQQAVDDVIFPRIMDATNVKDAWSTLQEEFQGSNKVCAIKLQSLRWDFELIKMKESETVKDYYSMIKEIVSQMKTCGKNNLGKKIVEKILISIPLRYDVIVTTIKKTKLKFCPPYQ